MQKNIQALIAIGSAWGLAGKAGGGGVKVTRARAPVFSGGGGGGAPNGPSG